MSDTLLQILKATGARPRVTFYADGLPSDLDSGVPAVTITRPDGTTIASGTVTHVGAAGSGTYEFGLAPQAQVTLLTVTWAGPIGGVTSTLTTRVEVLGGLLFTLAAAKAWDGGAIPAAGVTDAAILDMRELLTDDFERRCNVSFVGRFTRETRSANGADVLLGHPRATELLSVTVNGTAADVADYWLDPVGVLRPRSSYVAGPAIRSGVGNLTVEYVRGMGQPPGPVQQAALRVARALLVPSNIGDRATSITNDAGTILLSTAGRGQFQPYGIPLADSVLRAYFEPVAI
jgi:hypothetical protein